MRTLNKIKKLHLLQKQADEIRTKLKISQPSEVIYKANLYIIGDKTVIVEADGFGGATTKIIEGNYPIDYCTRFERNFTTEDEAVIAAEAIIVE